MSLAALILVGEYEAGEHPPLLFRIAGQTLLERLIRQVHIAGARHIVVQANSLPAEITSVSDELGVDGISISIARSAADAIDSIHPDERLIVVDGPLVVAQNWLEAVRDAQGAALVTVPRTSDPRFERIDATDHWLGLGAVDGAILRDVAKQLGDWVLGPTLLRRAVQVGAARLPFDEPHMALEAVRPQNETELAASGASLASIVTISKQGWFSGLIAKVGIARLVGFCIVRNYSYKMLDLISIILILIYLMLLFFQWPLLGAMAFLLACMAIMTSAALAQVTVSERRKTNWPSLLRDISVTALPLALAWFALPDMLWSATLVGGLWLCAQWYFIAAFPSKNRAIDAAGLMFTLGISCLLGVPSIGIALCIAALLVEHAINLRNSSAP